MAFEMAMKAEIAVAILACGEDRGLFATAHRVGTTVRKIRRAEASRRRLADVYRGGLSTVPDLPSLGWRRQRRVLFVIKLTVRLVLDLESNTS